jgi:CheY-like chemotaxis protein
MSSKQIRVLIVDDAAFTRDLMKKGMRTVFPGFQLDEAIHGKQAQSRLQGQTYDLVLCDWEMPEMSGDELLSWMRGNEATSTVPFIMVTSRGDRDHVVKAIELGVSNYLAKPFTTEKLADVVAKVMTKATGLGFDQLRALGRRKENVVAEGAVEALGAKSVGDTGLSGAIPIAARIDTNKPAENLACVKPKSRVVVPLRFGESNASCLLREISLQGLSGVIHSNSKLPGVLEPVVFDFDHVADDGAERINGYVHSLVARDNSQESEFINIDVRFVDDDPQKQQQLHAYIGQIET